MEVVVANNAVVVATVVPHDRGAGHYRHGDSPIVLRVRIRSKKLVGNYWIVNEKTTSFLYFQCFLHFHSTRAGICTRSNEHQLLLQEFPQSPQVIPLVLLRTF